MTGVTKLEAVLREVVAEARRNADFAARLDQAFATEPPKRASRRRAPGRLDPFDVLASGEDTLRLRLADLDVEELKDIVAEHGMDHSRLAMRWRRPERLIDLIVSETMARLAKGDAFRSD